ncbi:MAG: glutamate mutase L, partial [Candidatus Cloacimonadaceae bacterium]
KISPLKIEFSVPERYSGSVADATLHIEQALARIGLQLSLQQHLNMNFSISQIGHFLRIKNDELDPFHEQFFQEKLNAKSEFRLQDFQMLIGAGGVISHAPTAKQAAIMLIDGLQPRGLTELWRDKHFITPHLGKLSQVDKPAALELLKKECLEALCFCIRPLPHKLKAGKAAIRVELVADTGTKIIEVEGNKLIWIDNAELLKVNVKAHGGVQLAYEQKELSETTELPVLIDTRISGQFSFEQLNSALQLYTTLDVADSDAIKISQEKAPAAFFKGIQRRTFALPYAGKIYVSEGDKVNPDTLLAENLYDPPRIFILQVFRGRENQMEVEKFRKYLLVKNEDKVKSGQLIYKEDQSFLESIISTSSFNFYSPVRGKVEKIDWQNCTLMLREIQDYSFEPYVINVSAKLGVSPAFIKGALRKHKGDFVTTDELLAVKSWKKHDQILHSPVTGTLTEIDTKKGTVTIQYIRKDLKLQSCLQARVLHIAKNRFIELEYEGTTISGSIGFGKVEDGPVIWCDSFTETELKNGIIAVYPFALNREQLDIIARNKLAGIIVPSLQEEDIVHLLGYELGVGITGGEAIPFSIILTEGFGKLRFRPELAAALKDANGRHGVLIPHTQIRAGVVRPSLIIQ